MKSRCTVKESFNADELDGLAFFMTSFLENEAGDREELDDAAARPVLWLGLACRKVFVAAEGLTEGWKQIFLRGGDPAPDSDMLVRFHE